MPQTGPRRPTVTTRLSAKGITWLEQRARAEGLILPRGEPNRSEMIRLALAYAAQHMPKGWRP